MLGWGLVASMLNQIFSIAVFSLLHLFKTQLVLSIKEYACSENEWFIDILDCSLYILNSLLFSFVCVQVAGIGLEVVVDETSH